MGMATRRLGVGSPFSSPLAAPLAESDSPFSNPMASPPDPAEGLNWPSPATTSQELELPVEAPEADFSRTDEPSWSAWPENGPGWPMPQVVDEPTWPTQLTQENQLTQPMIQNSASIWPSPDQPQVYSPPTTGLLAPPSPPSVLENSLTPAILPPQASVSQEPMSTNTFDTVPEISPGPSITAQETMSTNTFDTVPEIIPGPSAMSQQPSMAPHEPMASAVEHTSTELNIPPNPSDPRKKGGNAGPAGTTPGRDFSAGGSPAVRPDISPEKRPFGDNASPLPKEPEGNDSFWRDSPLPKRIGGASQGKGDGPEMSVSYAGPFSPTKPNQPAKPSPSGPKGDAKPPPAQPASAPKEGAKPNPLPESPKDPVKDPVKDSVKDPLETISAFLSKLKPDEKKPDKPKAQELPPWDLRQLLSPPPALPKIPTNVKCPYAPKLYNDADALTPAMKDPKAIDECPLPNHPPIRDFHSDLNRCIPIHLRGQSIEWADGRYYQLTGTHAPFEINATLWPQEARLAGWHVSLTPTAPSIAVIRGNTNGASPHGHVAVVEHVFANGLACTSHWNHPTPMRRSMHVLKPNSNILFLSKPPPVQPHL